MTFEKSLYVIVIAKQFKNQRHFGIFKHQPLLKAHPDLKIIVAQLSQPGPFVKVWLAHKALRVGNALPYC